MNHLDAAEREHKSELIRELFGIQKNNRDH